MKIEKFSRPTVRYENFESTPFVVVVDVNKIPEVLDEARRLLAEPHPVPPEEINGLQIIVKKKLRSAAAVYIEEDREIKMQGTDTWREYTDLRKHALRIAKRKEKPKKQFRRFLYTKRLENYLATVPESRGIPFAEKLLLQAADRQLSGDLIHELSHFLDTVYKRHTAPFHGKYKNDPSEKQAFMIEDRLRTSQEWRTLVTIRKKKPLL